MSLGVSIMTNSRPLLQATCDVLLLNPSSIWLKQKCDSPLEPNPGPFDRELSTITSRLGHCLFIDTKEICIQNMSYKYTIKHNLKSDHERSLVEVRALVER